MFKVKRTVKNLLKNIVSGSIFKLEGVFESEW